MSCVCAFALTYPAHAQNAGSAKVDVRSGNTAEYSRLVFDWAASTPYTVKKVTSDQIEIEFKKPAQMNVSSDNAASTRIHGIEKISGDGQNLKLRVKIPQGATFRHFLIGNRVVVDVYGKATPAKTVEKPVAKPAIKPEPAKQPEAKAPPEKTSEKTPDVKTAEPAPKDEAPPAQAAETVPAVPAIPVPDVAEKAEPAPTVIEQAAAAVIEPHVITLSSTSALGIAVFERNDDLWIVADRGDITVPPQISGPQARDFPPMEPITLTGGTAWRMPLRNGVHAYAEGGGLVWKVALTPNERDIKSIQPERSFEPGQSVRGGTLLWPMQRVTKVLELQDPFVGDKILIATVDRSDQLAGPGRDYVDFEMLPSIAGVAIVPHGDDLALKPVATGAQLSRPGGLAITRTRDVTQKVMEQNIKTPSAHAATDSSAASNKRIYDFDRWMMGGLNALRDNQHVILSTMSAKDKTGRVQDLLMLAKMNIANDRGQEAIGLLTFAENEMPEITESPEFLALRGAAEAMAGKFEIAFKDLSTPSLKDYKELDYWRAYALAGLEDWQQAGEALPEDFDVLLDYPRQIQERLALKLAEIALRSGDIPRAETLLDALEKDKQTLKPWTLAGLNYLIGEKHRQEKQPAQAEALWKPLSTGKDDLYRAKASLALTMLQLQNNQIKRDVAIDRLEGLRYHWRGDELESQINFMLGKMYLEDGRYLKGFSILRDATVITPDSEISREIAGYMATNFRDLFLTKKVNDLTPIDAVTVYEEFRELTPPGAEGNTLVQRLAERLVDADLLGRASVLLQHQFDFRLTGQEAGVIGQRLAAIYLLNDEPKKAIPVIDKAAKIFSAIEPKDADIEAKLKELEMLRARALSDEDNVNGALAVLNKYPPSPEVNRLRADIAWNAGQWEDAAEALNDLILDEDIDPSRVLTQKQADLLLNRAVALNLSGDRVALANMRARFATAMDKTSRAKMFDLVTRPRTGNLSSDRESIAALVSEVDMFKEFLDSYRASNAPSN